MNESVEEFLNPKAMLTPSIAAGIVALITGAMFKYFGLPHALVALVLSLLICTLLFLGRSLKDPKLHFGFKAIFYVLNALIVWATALGAHLAIASDATPLVVQDRPLFVDWRSLASEKKVSTSTLPDAPKISATSHLQATGFAASLADAGLITPDYKVSLQLDRSQIPGGRTVKSVKWVFDSPLMSQQSLVTDDSSKDFRIDAKAWKSFDFQALITLDSGQIIRQSGTVAPAALAKQ